MNGWVGVFVRGCEMRALRIPLLLALASMLTGGEVNGNIVPYGMSGTVSRVSNNSFFPGINVGDPWTGRFTYSTEMTRIGGNEPYQTEYQQSPPIAPLAISFTINGTVISGAQYGPLYLSVANNAGAGEVDEFYLWSRGVTGLPEKDHPYTFVSLFDTSGRAFSSTAIRASLNLAAFDEPKAGVWLGNGGIINLGIDALTRPFPTAPDPIQPARVQGKVEYPDTYKYHLEFDSSKEVVATINVKLTGDPPTGPKGEDLKDIWEKDIKSTWTGQYDVVDGSNNYPIRLDVNWVTSKEDLTVVVHKGSGITNSLNFYTDSTTGIIAAHEAGHWLGLYDEYNPMNKNAEGVRPPAWWPLYNYDGTTLLDFWKLYEKPHGKPLADDVWKELSKLADTSGLMGFTGPMRPRYYQRILDWLGNETGRSLILAEAPTFSQRDPSYDFTDLPPGEIPEPGTVALLVAGAVAALLWWQRRRNP